MIILEYPQSAMSSLSSNLIAHLPEEYIAYSGMRIIRLINLSVTDITKSNALRAANVDRPSIKSNVIRYPSILIVLIGCKFSKGL